MCKSKIASFKANNRVSLEGFQRIAGLAVAFNFFDAALTLACLNANMGFVELNPLGISSFHLAVKLSLPFLFMLVGTIAWRQAEKEGAVWVHKFLMALALFTAIFFLGVLAYNIALAAYVSYAYLFT